MPRFINRLGPWRPNPDDGWTHPVEFRVAVRLSPRQESSLNDARLRAVINYYVIGQSIVVVLLLNFLGRDLDARPLCREAVFPRVYSNTSRSSRLISLSSLSLSVSPFESLSLFLASRLFGISSKFDVQAATCIRPQIYPYQSKIYPSFFLLQPSLLKQRISLNSAYSGIIIADTRLRVAISIVLRGSRVCVFFFQQPQFQI